LLYLNCNLFEIGLIAADILSVIGGNLSGLFIYSYFGGSKFYAGDVYTEYDFFLWGGDKSSFYYYTKVSSTWELYKALFYCNLISSLWDRNF
jgi:hypothetical protein